METEMADMKELAQSVLEKTREDKIQWEMTSSDFFQTPIQNKTLTIDNHQRTFTLILRNDDGIIVDSLNANVYGSADDTILLRELFSVVRRKTLKVDETLNDILRHLDGL